MLRLYQTNDIQVPEQTSRYPVHAGTINIKLDGKRMMLKVTDIDSSGIGIKVTYAARIFRTKNCPLEQTEALDIEVSYNNGKLYDIRRSLQNTTKRKIFSSAVDSAEG